MVAERSTQVLLEGSMLAEGSSRPVSESAMLGNRSTAPSDKGSNVSENTRGRRSVSQCNVIDGRNGIKLTAHKLMAMHHK